MLGWFRRHATVLMVVLGSAAMVIFGLGPAFDQLARGGGGGQQRELNEVVARWNGGDIRRNDLDKLQRNHFSMQRFLQALREAAVKKKGDAIQSLAIPIALLQGTTQDEIDQELVFRLMLAERAKEEGIVASEDMVDDYLVLIALSEKFSPAEHRAINKEVNPNAPLDIIRDHLKLELLANQIRMYSQGGTLIFPNPTEAMELYGKTSNQIECEVLPIVVEDYISKVTEKPSASELKKIYEEGKYDYPDVEGIKPGFKVPRKVNVQYFKANYEYFLAKEMAKLTDAEVQAEYDRLVKEKDKLVMEPATEPDPAIELNELPPETESSNKSDDTKEDAPEGVAPPPATDGDKSDGAMKDEKSSADNKPNESGKTDEPVKTDSEKSTQVEETKEKSSSEKTEEDAKSQDAEKSSESKEATDEDKSKAESSESVKESESESDSKADDSKKEGESNEESDGNNSLSALVSGRRDQRVSTIAPQTDDQSSDDDEVQPPPQTESSSTDDTTTQDETSQQSTEQSTEGSETDAESEDTPAEPERKPKPLSEVAVAVKRSMCRQAVRDEINRLLRDKAYNKIEDYSQDLFDAEADPELEHPGDLDAVAIGKEFNLDFEETGLVNFVELSNLEIGRQFLFEPVGVGSQRQNRPITVPQKIFSNFNRLREYDSKAVDSFLQDSYLYWVSEVKEARVPEFSECKQEVEDYWRRQRAFELARAEAESIQKKVDQSGGKMLEELFPGRAQKTGAFTWMTSSSQSGYSQPSGVKSVGEEFMSVAFSLDQFKAGVAANNTRDTIYVIQLQTEPKPISDTGTDYIENQFFRFKRVPNDVGFASSMLNSRRASSDWYDETFKDMGLKFLNQ